MTKITQLKDISSMILWQIAAEIKVMKEDTPAKKYKIWFQKDCKVFHEVDNIKSKDVAKRNNAKLKQCYYNSFRGFSEPGMKYYEGYVWSASCPIPLEHSWLVKDGKVIDPTLILDTKYSNDRLGDEYVGIEIPRDFLLSRCVKTMKSGPFLFDYFAFKHLKKLWSELK